MMRFGILLIILLISLPLSSQEWRYIHPYKGVNIFATLGFAYDDNVFKYSDGDIDKFVNNREPYRYPIETYDDLITKIQMHAKIRNKLLMGRSTTFNLKIKGNLYYQNSFKDYGSASVSMWHRVGKDGNLLLKYLFLPRYFIRYYPDFDVTTPYEYPYFTDCSFMKHQFGFSVGYLLFDRFDLSASYNKEINDYNDAFNEYDTDRNEFGISAGFSYRDLLYPALKYSFAIADAKALDEPGESKEMSDDSDISHDEDELQLSLDIDFTQTKPFRIETDLALQRRYYTTDKPVLVDPTHAGREDTRIGFRALLLFIPTERVTVSLGYAFEQRAVSTPYDINQIEDIKNYTRNIISGNIGFSY